MFYEFLYLLVQYIFIFNFEIEESAFLVSVSFLLWSYLSFTCLSWLFAHMVFLILVLILNMTFFQCSLWQRNQERWLGVKDLSLNPGVAICLIFSLGCSLSDFISFIDNWPVSDTYLAEF